MQHLDRRPLKCPEFVCDFIDEVAVVANDDYGALKALQVVLKDVDGSDI